MSGGLADLEDGFPAPGGDTARQVAALRDYLTLLLENLRYMHERMPYIDECSIGHALICDALYLGLEETIHRYLACLA